MTPKEKAQELVSKLQSFADTYHYGNLANAKQCALIVVNETINALEIHQWQNKGVIEYYLEIKQEIEKL